MKFKRILSLALALALLLSCAAFSPVRAAESEQTESAETVHTTQDAPSKGLEAPKFVDSERFSQSDHVERLYHEERLDTYVYRNRDGTKSVYYMGQNVKYEDENGNIRDKDTTLIRGERGYRMRDNDVDLHLPDSPADGITLAHSNRSVRLLPQGGSGTANLENNSITYPGYFGAETALRYTPLLSGVKEDIILSSYTGQNSFSFVLETGGLYLYEADGQYYLAENETAEAAFYLGQVVVYDAMGRPDVGSMTVEILVPGQQYRLTLSADVDYLTDPQTVYPVTIDPSLTVSYTTHGVNAIVDAPIYEGKPSSNYSNYYYDRVGYYNDEYMTARTVMRPDALLSSDEWQRIGKSDIDSLKLYIKESSGKTAKQVDIYALTENSIWTESNVTWNNVGAYSSTVYASATLGSDTWAEFNLTTLAEAWKDGTEDEACGFLLKLADESTYRTFYSCEYSTVDYRPYVVLEYTEELTLNYSTKEIAIGSSFTLSATTQLGTQVVPVWVSNNENVATVSESGVVTGLKAGKATITATYIDGDGIEHNPTCDVYVTLADGIYYIKNAATYLCLQAAEANAYMYAQKTDQATRFNQLWKISYAAEGCYVIRPLQDLSVIMDVNDNEYLVIADAPAADASVAEDSLWRIEYDASGYALMPGGSKTEAIMPVSTGMSGSQVITTHLSTSTSCHWTFEEAYGVFLRDTDTLKIVTASTERTIELGKSYTLAELGMQYEVSGDAIGGPTWVSTNSTIANFKNTGSITPSYGGTVTLTMNVNIGGTTYSNSFNLICILPLSGYELEYEPDLWNNGVIEAGTNCYAYVLNVQINPSTGKLWYMQPGEAAGHGDYLPSLALTAETIENYTADDSDTLGFEFTEIDKTKACAAGFYKIALAIDTYGDYHWYRQNPDGTWSHKVGDTAVTNLDASNNIIYDPSIADKNYTGIGGYNYVDFLCYYQVSSLDYLYSTTYILSQYSNTYVTQPKFTSVYISAQLEIGMSQNDVITILGTPNRRLSGTGNTVAYCTSDNKTVVITYELVEAVLCISSINIMSEATI